MPIYEYACDQCGKEFEELVFDDSTPSCPHCGSARTHKLMSCCCVHGTGQADGGEARAASGGGGGCAGCSGGHCASCGH